MVWERFNVMFHFGYAGASHKKQKERKMLLRVIKPKDGQKRGLQS